VTNSTDGGAMRPEEGDPSSPAHRSLPTTIAFSTAALGSFGAIVYLGVTGARPSTLIVGGGLLGIFGLLCVIWAFASSKSASCPRCSSSVSMLADGVELYCTCEQLVMLRGDRLHALGARYAAASPRFAMPLTGQTKLPAAICAACGAPATRMVEVSYRMSLAKRAAVTLANAAAGSLAFVDEKATCQVAHCETHDDGACIIDRDKPTIELVVKSYGYAQALSGMNDSGRPDLYKAGEYTGTAQA
jgi:hypothetical protein